MNLLKKTIQAITLAFVTSQASCYSVPAVSPSASVTETPKTKDMVDLVNEHWSQYRARFKQDFDASKKSCSVEKKKLSLSMSCYVPSKHPLHQKDGLYFNVVMSNFTKRDGEVTEHRFSVREGGTEKFEYLEAQYPDFTMRRLDFTVPGLCQELRGNHGVQVQHCSDHLSVSFGNNKISFIPVTSTDYFGDVVQARKLRSFLEVARHAERELKSKLGVQEWFDWQVEEAKQERSHALEPLVKKFAATMKTTRSYRSLVGDAQFKPLFEQYSQLSKPVMGVARLNSTIEDPNRLNEIVEQINAASKELPGSDQSALQKTLVYIARDEEEMQKECENKVASACYDKNTKTIILPPENPDLKGTLIHELAHHYINQLPSLERFGMKTKLRPLLMREEVQTEAIRHQETNLVKSWQDGSDEPRFNCPKPYAASNFDEYVAIYKEDLFNNRGIKIISLLDPKNKKYHEDVITTLETLAESGLFGDEARETLDDLYRRAVVIYGK